MYSLAHIGIRTADLERAVSFYVGGLGGQLGEEYHLPSGSHIIFVHFDDFAVELICKPGDERIPGRNHLAFSVPSIHDAVRRLSEAGYAVSENDISPMGKHGLNCFVNGPDGEIVELCEGTL